MSVPRSDCRSVPRLAPAILVSAGKIGRQVELAPEALAGLVGAAFAPIVKDGAA